MTTKPALHVANEISDAARSLVKLAHAVIDAAARVESWATSPATEQRATIPDAVDKAAADLRAAVAAHIDTGRPSIEQLRWRMQIACDRLDDLSPFGRDDLAALSPEWFDVQSVYDIAYADYLRAQREYRAHPDFKPKRPKKPAANKRPKRTR